MTSPTFVLLAEYREYPLGEMRRRAAAFYADLCRRRTVREFGKLSTTDGPFAGASPERRMR